MSRDRLIDAYLDQLERALTHVGEGKARILEEVRDHLLTSVEEEVGKGYSRAEAERRALERFGRPEAIAAQFSPLSPRRRDRSQSKHGRRRGRQSRSDSRRSVMFPNRVASEGGLDRCSFCDKLSDVGRELRAGTGGVAICDECLRLGTEIVASARGERGSAANLAEHRPTHRDHDDRKPRYFCSFCGREHAEVERLIAGPRFVFICDRCVDQFTVAVAGGAPTG